MINNHGSISEHNVEIRETMYPKLSYTFRDNHPPQLNKKHPNLIHSEKETNPSSYKNRQDERRILNERYSQNKPKHLEE